jgi:hypothetical protein
VKNQGGHLNALAEPQDIDVGQKAQHGPNDACIRFADE